MKKIFLAIFFSVLLLVAFSVAAALMLIADSSSHMTEVKETITSSEVGTEGADGAKNVQILAMGDLVMHPPVYEQNAKGDGTYTFDTFFAKVQPELDKADVRLANFEAPSDATRPPNGYPVFNAPQGLIPYLKNTGFDAVATANNHSLDAGLDGLVRTIAEMDSHGLAHFGTRMTPDGGTCIVEKNGIKIGLCGWSTFYNGFENGVSDEDRFKISPLTEENVKRDIKHLRAQGADIIVAWPHWGTEYTVTPGDEQVAYARMLVKNGADVILGSHPHVQEPAGWLEVDGRRAWIIYSMGNIMSNQREAYLGTIDTEIGIFVKLDIEKKGKKTVVKKAELVPTYVNLFTDENGRVQYEVINLRDALADDGNTPNQKARFQQAYERAREIMNNPLPQEALTEETKMA